MVWSSRGGVEQQGVGWCGAAGAVWSSRELSGVEQQGLGGVE